MARKSWLGSIFSRGISIAEAEQIEKVRAARASFLAAASEHLTELQRNLLLLHQRAEFLVDVDFYTTFDQLEIIRQESQKLLAENEFAIGATQTRINYVVGEGHVYTLEPRSEDEPGGLEKTREEINTVWIPEYLDAVDWYTRQCEVILRGDRDGEVFLTWRDYEAELQSLGPMVVVAPRFIEPWQIRPNGQDGVEYGIEHDPQDPEKPLKYWYVVDKSENPSPIDAEEIQHRKFNVDVNCDRGMPLFWMVRKNLRAVEVILERNSTLVEIRTAFALIRKTANVTQSAVANIGKDLKGLPAKGELQSLWLGDPKGGSLETEGLPTGGGLIVNEDMNSEHVFPSLNLSGEDMKVAVQTQLRPVAAALCLPEYMFTADASNSNYSSTLVAETPAVRNFRRMQYRMMRDDEKFLRKALTRTFELNGRSDLAECLAQSRFKATPPTIETRDHKAETERYAILYQNQIIARQEWSAAEGFDFERTQQLQEEDPAGITNQIFGSPANAARGTMPGSEPGQDGSSGNSGDSSNQ